MNAKRPTITYDADARILSIRTARARSVDSDIFGNVVVDYDASGQPVNIDIMECSLAEFRTAVPVRQHIRSRRRTRSRAHV